MKHKFVSATVSFPTQISELTHNAHAISFDVRKVTALLLPSQIEQPQIGEKPAADPGEDVNAQDRSAFCLCHRVDRDAAFRRIGPDGPGASRHDPSCPGCRLRRGYRGHRAAPSADAPGGADRRVGLLCGGAATAADRQRLRSAVVAAEHHLFEGQFQRIEFHDPRYRRSVRRHLVRCGNRHSHQRHPAVRHAHFRDRIFRSRACRGAARPAGHAVRSQRHVGRDQLHFRQATYRPILSVGRGRIRQLRFDPRQGDDQRAVERHHGRSPRRFLPEPRRLHQEPV